MINLNYNNHSFSLIDKENSSSHYICKICNVKLWYNDFMHLQNYNFYFGNYLHKSKFEHKLLKKLTCEEFIIKSIIE